MSRSDLWKWLVLGGLAVISAAVVIPPFDRENPDGTKRPGKIRRGLDIEGGTSFTVAIDQEKLRSNIVTANPDLKENEIASQINKILAGTDSRTVEIIRNRIDKLGMNEPLIQAGKEHRINIQLPGATEEQRNEAEKSIQSAAFLEFKLVHPQNNAMVDKLLTSGRVPEGYVAEGSGFRRGSDYDMLAKDPDYLQRLSLFEVPDPRYAFMLERTVAGSVASKEVIYRPVFVLRKAEMTGEALSSAETVTDPVRGVQVALKFNSKGAAEFGKLTKKHVGRQLAIIMDDTLYSAPRINTEILGGNAEITGSFSVAEANSLRNILNAGALPAPMKIIEKRAIDPTLGKDTVKSGLTAGIIGILLIMAFMLMYYMYCGLVANVALVLNLLLLPAGLIFASNILGVFVKDTGGVASGNMLKHMTTLPVLTMPGIAGIILTLAMAVDANVLIFERMREEFATGKSARAAVMAGYERAFLAIFDSNTTTLLVATLLFIFGVGPLRGYAVMLFAGIIISMFTALVVTRLIFNATVSETRTAPFKMFQIFKSPSFDFLKPAKLCIITSLGIIIATSVLFVVRVINKPSDVLTVDFAGGAAISYSCEQKADVGDVRAIVEKIVNVSTIQYQSTPGGADVLLIMTSDDTTVISEENPDTASVRIAKALSAELPDSGFKFISEDSVGAVVGSDLKRAAFWATLLSLIGMLVYISLRFEFGFALGAILAVAHDTLFTLGVYSLFGGRMSLIAVAAILTVVGYSINDSIVILDRIREDVKKDSKAPFSELCNRAINATLSRTVLTSGTTLFAVLALFLFGGGALKEFALMLLVGVVVGSYSSVFIATPITLAWYRGRRPAFMRSENK